MPKLFGKKKKGVAPAHQEPIITLEEKMDSGDWNLNDLSELIEEHGFHKQFLQLLEQKGIDTQSYGRRGAHATYNDEERRNKEGEFVVFIEGLAREGPYSSDDRIKLYAMIPSGKYIVEEYLKTDRPDLAEKHIDSNPYKFEYDPFHSAEQDVWSENIRLLCITDVAIHYSTKSDKVGYQRILKKGSCCPEGGYPVPPDNAPSRDSVFNKRAMNTFGLAQSYAKEGKYPECIDTILSLKRLRRYNYNEVFPGQELAAGIAMCTRTEEGSEWAIEWLLDNNYLLDAVWICYGGKRYQKALEILEALGPSTDFSHCEFGWEDEVEKGITYDEILARLRYQISRRKKESDK